MEDVALKVMFSRIFELSANKMATVAEMEHFRWGEIGEAWKWCRPLRAWEEDQLRECSTYLNSIILQDDVTNRWRWNVHTTESYIVNNAYNFLQQTSSQYINEDDFHVFWHKDVPTKVNIFVWRLLLNRLPTNYVTPRFPNIIFFSINQSKTP